MKTKVYSSSIIMDIVDLVSIKDKSRLILKSEEVPIIIADTRVIEEDSEEYIIISIDGIDGDFYVLSKNIQDIFDNNMSEFISPKDKGRPYKCKRYYKNLLRLSY